MAEQELKKRLPESKDCFIPPAVYTFYHVLLILSGQKKKKKISYFNKEPWMRSTIISIALHGSLIILSTMPQSLR